MALAPLAPTPRSLRYLDFALEIRTSPGGGLEIGLLPQAGAGKPVPFEPPLSLDEIGSMLERIEGALLAEGFDRHAAEATRRFRPLDSATTEIDLAALGQAMHAALLPQALAEAYSFQLGSLQSQADGGLRLRLVLDPDVPQLARLGALPWELTTPPDLATPLALDPRRTIVRYLVPRTPQPPPLALGEGETLRVLVAGASPESLPPLSLDVELAALQALEVDRPLPSFHLERDITPSRLREALWRYRPHVLLFAGHGAFDEASGQALLYLHGDHDPLIHLTAAELARLLTGLSDLRLVVLNACEGARFPRHAGLDPWSGIAQALVREGIPSVIAHQFSIKDASAIAFSRALLGCLMERQTIEQAVAEGRQAIAAARPGSWEWASPVLYTRLADGGLPAPSPAVVAPLVIRAKIRDQSRYLESRRRGFVGREWVYARFESFLERCRNRKEGGYFFVYGDPGIGKSALLAEAVHRHRWLHHFAVRAADLARTEVFLENLCAQLIARHGLPHSSLPPEAGRDPGFLARLLEEAVGRQPDSAAPLVVVIDALDEAEVEASSRQNPLCLPPFLPPGVVFLVSSQRLPREPEVRSAFERLDIEAGSAENRADIAAYLHQCLPRPGIQAYLAAQGLTSPALIELLAEKSQGNFMYLHYVLAALEEEGTAHPSLDKLPLGLQGYYETHWTRMRGLDERAFLSEKVPVLLALTVAREPIPLSEIPALSGIDNPALVAAVLREWRPFLDRTRVRDSDVEVPAYRLYHGSFHTFLCNQPEITASRLVRRAQQKILENLLARSRTSAR